MTDTFDELLFSLDEGVATITLNRPDQLNSLTPPMLSGLPELLARAARDGARCILVTGAGRAFCSGAALSADFTGPKRDLGALVDSFYNPIARAFAESPIPIVTAINGPAAGAGASIALWGDLIVAARSAYLLFAFANIGLVPDAGSSWLVAKALGRVKALELVLLGEKLPAEAALAAGLVTRVVDDAELATEARALAIRIAERPTLAMGLIRRQMVTALDDGLEATLSAEAENQRRAGASEDFVEGVLAFREKRKPVFKGR